MGGEGGFRHFSSSFKAVWAIASIYYPFVVCFFYAVIYTFKPSEAYLVPYIVTDLGISESYLLHTIFPVWTYAYTVFVIVLGISAELIGYRINIALGMVGNLTTVIMLIVFSAPLIIALSEIPIGLYSAAEVIFSAYIYKVVEEEHYYIISSIVRMGRLLGVVSSALVGQALVQFVPLRYLFYLTFLALATGLFGVIFLPSPLSSTVPFWRRWKGGASHWKVVLLHTVCKQSFWYWSIWLVCGGASHMLSVTFWQSKMNSLDADSTFNGLIYAASYLIASISTIIPAILERYHPSLLQYGLFTAPVLYSIALLGYGVASSTFYAALFFILWNVLFEMHYPLALAKLASTVEGAHFGLAFGVVFLFGNFTQSAVQFTIQQLALPVDQSYLFLAAFTGFTPFLGYATVLLLPQVLVGAARLVRAMRFKVNVADHREARSQGSLSLVNSSSLLSDEEVSILQEEGPGSAGGL